MFKHIKDTYTIRCPNTKFKKKHWWKFVLLDIIAHLLRISFEVNTVNFGSHIHNPWNSQYDGN